MLDVRQIRDGTVTTVPAERLAEVTGARDAVLWVHLTGAGDAAKNALCVLGVDEWVAEDVLQTSTHPKGEAHEHYLFAVVHALQVDPDRLTLSTVELDAVLGSDWLVTHTERPLALVDTVLAAAERKPAEAGSAARLLHLLLDLMLDEYEPFLDDFIPQRVDDIETALFDDRPDPAVRREIALRRRDVVRLLRIATPQSEAVRRMAVTAGEATRPLLADIADRMAYVAAQTESLRQQLDTAFDHYQSSVANAQNEVMKVLTMVSAVLLPITVVAGIYGMNFRYMPELDQRWGYPAVLGLCLLIIAVNLVLFRSKGWIGSRRHRLVPARTLTTGAGRVLRAPAMGARVVGRSAARLAPRRPLR